MSTDFSNIGFEVNSGKDVLALAQNCSNEDSFFSYGDIHFAVVKPDRNSELWFYGDEDGINGTGCELYYESPHVLEGENWGWSVKPDEDESSGIIKIMCDGGNTDFPLNITLPDAFLYADEELDERLRVRMTWFAQDISVYDDEEDYTENSGSGMTVESCIPCGTFALPGCEEGFKQTSTAIMSGRVTFAEKRTNDYTGNEYWFITVDCCGHVFDIVADTEFCRELVVPENIVHGSFWISGKLTEDEVTDECEGRSQEVIMTRPVNEWCMGQIAKMLMNLRPVSYEHLIVEFENILDDKVEYIQTYKCDEEDYYEVEIGFNREETGEKPLLIGGRLHGSDMFDTFLRVCMNGEDPHSIDAVKDFEVIDYGHENEDDDAVEEDAE